MPSRLEPLIVALEQAFQDVRDGKQDPKEAGAMSTLALTISKLLQVGELEERVRSVERLIAAQRDDTHRWA